METLNIPFYSQVKDIENPIWRREACGVVCLKMVMDYYKPTGLTPDQLFQMGVDSGAYSQDVGWYHHGLSELARQLGYKSLTRSWVIPNETLEKYKNRGFTEEEIELLDEQLYKEGIFNLKNELTENHPVIVSVAKDLIPGESGHLIVLSGFNEEGFVANDPYDENREGRQLQVDFPKFKAVWTKRAVLVHP